MRRSRKDENTKRIGNNTRDSFRCLAFCFLCFRAFVIKNLLRGPERRISPLQSRDGRLTILRGDARRAKWDERSRGQPIVEQARSG